MGELRSGTCSYARVLTAVWDNHSEEEEESLSE